MENAKHNSMAILVKNHNKRACRVVMLISMKMSILEGGGGEGIAIWVHSCIVWHAAFCFLQTSVARREWWYYACVALKKKVVVFIL